MKTKTFYSQRKNKQGLSFLNIQKSKWEALSITYKGKVSANAKHFPMHDHSGILWQIP